MRLVFFGTPSFALPFLHALLQEKDMEVIGVVTQPDKPADRGQKPQASPVKIAAQERGLPVFDFPSLKTPEAQQSLPSLSADAFVVVAYGKIIPRPLLTAARLGCINVHPSLLPRHRGPSPMPWTILEGDMLGGVTIMQLDAGMDTGPILTQEPIPIDPHETLETLQAKVHLIGPPLLVKTLKLFHAGAIHPQAQDETKATTTRRLTKEDGRANWSQPAVFLERSWRAFEPWPGLWTVWERKGKSLRILLKEVSVVERDCQIPGRVHILGKKNLFVETGQGYLEIHRLQPEGKSVMSVEVFVRGYRDMDGVVLV
jgi:methionyl-tRNA formyltransferase